VSKHIQQPGRKLYTVRLDTDHQKLLDFLAKHFRTDYRTVLKRLIYLSANELFSAIRTEQEKASGTENQGRVEQGSVVPDVESAGVPVGVDQAGIATE
jgi:hypothetical protein